MNKTILKIIVLGGTGMLGLMVQDYLSKNVNFVVTTTSREIPIPFPLKSQNNLQFDAEKATSPADLVFVNEYDYVVNCIGIIKPYCKDNDKNGVERAIRVNALFPHLLAKAITTAKVVQIATDCVYTGSKGNYVEASLHDALDVYGKTKSLGEIFYSKNFLNIRCSIIGPEKRNKLSLLEWFLSQPDNAKLTGYKHHKWNGVTTLQYAQMVEKIILDNSFDDLRKINSTLHYIPNQTVTKAELLTVMAKAFKKSIIVNPVDDIGPTIDRTVSTSFPLAFSIVHPQPMQLAMDELASYMNNL